MSQKGSTNTNLTILRECDVKKNLKTVFKNVHVIYLSSFDSKASRLITIIRVNGLFIY